MSKKKVPKAAPKKKPAAAPTAKSLTKTLTKSVSKLTKKIVAAVAKPAAKPAKKTAPVETSAGHKPKKIEKKLVKSEPSTLKSEKAPKAATPKEENTGDTLIEMARAEMAAVKIGQTADKVEKASKFKAIKVERGNLADEKAKWIELNKRYGKDKAISYKMSEAYEALKPVQHKVLGWGFVLTNENDRLEVLFENGIKMLISNYKPN